MSIPTKTIFLRHLEDVEIPTDLSRLIGLLRLTLALAPREYRDCIKVDCSPCYRSEEALASMDISYDRPMTPEEVEAEQLRIDAERLARADGWSRRRPLSEIPDLYFLQAKGGPA